MNNSRPIAKADTFWEIVRNGDVQALQKLAYPAEYLEQKEIIEGDTPLVLAARLGKSEMVQALLAAKADLEAKDKYGFTPLAIAVEGDHVDTAQALLAAKADLEAKDDYDCTPLASAAREGHTATVRVLLTAKADLKTKDSDGCTPLALAATGGYTNIIQALLVAKADLKTTDKNGYTPLALAAGGDHTDAAQALVAAKADLEAKDKKYGCTSLALAAYRGYTDTAQVLLAAKADLEAKGKDDYRPLALAAIEGHTDTVQVLVAAKADLEAKDKDGRTPLMLVKLAGYLVGHTEIAQFLSHIKRDRRAKNIINYSNTLSQWPENEQLDFIRRIEARSTACELARLVRCLTGNAQLEIAQRNEAKITQGYELAAMLDTLPEDSRSIFAQRHIAKIRSRHELTTIVKSLAYADERISLLKSQLNSPYLAKTDISLFLDCLPADSRIDLLGQERLAKINFTELVVSLKKLPIEDCIKLIASYLAIHEGLDKYDIETISRLLVRRLPLLRVRSTRDLAKLKQHISRIQAQQKHRENWLRLAPFLAFVRANQLSPLALSISPLIDSNLAISERRVVGQVAAALAAVPVAGIAPATPPPAEAAAVVATAATAPTPATAPAMPAARAPAAALLAAGIAGLASSSYEAKCPTHINLTRFANTRFFRSHLAPTVATAAIVTTAVAPASAAEPAAGSRLHHSMVALRTPGLDHPWSTRSAGESGASSNSASFALCNPAACKSPAHASMHGRSAGESSASSNSASPSTLTLSPQE